MTPEQIDALPAGPEIDELAARTVMRMTEQQINLRDFRPSTLIGHTQRLWDELDDAWVLNHRYENGEWAVWIHVRPDTRMIEGKAPTLELAMTRAAIKAAGKET